MNNLDPTEMLLDHEANLRDIVYLEQIISNLEGFMSQSVLPVHMKEERQALKIDLLKYRHYLKIAQDLRQGITKAILERVEAP